MSSLTFSRFRFLKRFFPVCAAAMFLTMPTLSIATASIMQLHFEHISDYHLYMVAFLMACAVILSSAQYAIVRGRGEATWIIVLLVGVCIVANLRACVTLGRDISPLIGLLTGLCALACFNSRRYRQFCKHVKVIRRLRERVIERPRRSV